MSDWPITGEPNRVIISPYSAQALGTEYAALAAAAPASVAHATVNMLRAYPFVLPEPMLVRKVWWHNGGVISGFTDVGVYSEDGTRMLASGAILQATINVLQEFDIADVPLGRGTYYLALTSNSATATYLSNILGIQLAKLLGWGQVALGAAGLPATITLAAAAAAIQPIFGISGRTLVV